MGDTTEVTRYEDFSSPFGICDLPAMSRSGLPPFMRPIPAVDGSTTIWPESSHRVMRGGSCARNGDLARGARRHGPFEGEPFKYKGFRLAVDARLHS